MTRNVFVTGTSSGIGQEIAIALLRAGYRVVGLSRRQSATLNDYPYYTHVQLDLSDLDGLEQAVADGRLGDGLRCDAAFLNAGTFGPPPVHSQDLALADFLEVMKVNCVANKVLLDALACQNRSIRIAVSSSISAVRYRAGMSAYSASKAALNAMASIYAQDNPQLFIANIGLCNVETPLSKVVLTPNAKLEELSRLRERAQQPGYLSPPSQRATQLIQVLECPEKYGVRSGEFVEIRSLENLFS